MTKGDCSNGVVRKSLSRRVQFLLGENGKMLTMQRSGQRMSRNMLDVFEELQS